MDEDTPLYCILESAFNFYSIEAENHNFDPFPRLPNRFYQRSNAVAGLN